ncbi:MAG: 6-methylsalicylate decarboxylase [Miltoncostaeaceae bacterium]|jgi:predicted TIM-barrel fold metal-dependent hydrolase|nr:6-methylsalicylate decarboxylase [Miltoncostaeaceae bacterium]
MVCVDVHQHLWPEPLLAALARRDEPPFIRRRGRRWVLSLTGEADWAFDPDRHDAHRRAALLAGDGVDLAVVSLSSPLGIESLPPDDAEELMAAYHDGAAELPRGLAAWASAALTQPRPDLLAERLARGFVGLCLPAAALATPEGWDRCGPLLAVLEAADAPLFVHPGPAPWAPVPASEPGLPDWWPAMTSYVSQMQAAWHAFHAIGRPRHPALRACFALLAGLAPLHDERLAARCGRAPLVDDRVFLDVSSYGRRAVEAVIDVVGLEQLVYGSDRPVVEPAALALGGPGDAALRAVNPARLLDRTEVPA